MKEIELLIDELNKSLEEKESEISGNEDIPIDAYALGRIALRREDIKSFEESFKKARENRDTTLRAEIRNEFRKQYYKIKRDIEDIKN